MIDVARVAGVSAQTVSRALSGHPYVQPETRAKVLAAVEELGYRRNNAARILSSGRSRTIGVVLLETIHTSRIALTVGIEKAARSHGYSTTTATAASLDETSISAAIARLAEQGVDGMILAVPLHGADDVTRSFTDEIPTISIDGSRTDATDIVAVDQQDVARLATEHLLSLGHPTVWHVAGPKEWQETAGRLAGWRRALEQAGRDIPPVLHGDWSPQSGFECGELLARIPEASAVFVASDEMAFGVIRALAEHGRSVPDDVSVVGVDDIPLAAFCNPPLTTIAQPFAEVGRLAVMNLLSRLSDMSNAEAGPIAVAVSPELIVRRSTARKK
jgi:DNA-binding LacI/PurR family transcriptional regulator